MMSVDDGDDDCRAAQLELRWIGWIDGMDRLQKAKKAKRVSRGRDGATEWPAEGAQRDAGGRAGQQEMGRSHTTTLGTGPLAPARSSATLPQLNAQSGQVRERGKGPKRGLD
jgi:hypothetical protein